MEHFRVSSVFWDTIFRETRDEVCFSAIYPYSRETYFISNFSYHHALCSHNVKEGRFVKCLSFSVYYDSYLKEMVLLNDVFS